MVRHEWGVLGTASAASSHCEENMVPWVVVQSRGPRSTHREATYLQLGNPAICVYVCVLCDICSRQGVCLHMQTNVI